MKLRAPKYYKDFVCIADKCKHSCCVGWEIDVDGQTAEKYASLNDGYGKEIKESICFEESAHFKLKANDRCPHLSDSGLCNIILKLGDAFLCDICREHPRFYNYTSHGKEVGLGMSCEEAARIILSSDEYDKFIDIGNVDGDSEVLCLDSVKVRSEIYSLLKNEAFEYTDKLRMIYKKYGVSPALHTDSEWREILASLEYLDETHKELFSSYSSSLEQRNGLGAPLSRALAYFIYRHASEAASAEELRASLGFCLFAERLLASIKSLEIEDAARIISEELEYSEENTDAVKFEFYAFNN